MTNGEATRAAELAACPDDRRVRIVVHTLDGRQIDADYIDGALRAVDFDARYAVDGYPGIAFFLRGYVRTPLVDKETGEELRAWMGEMDDAYEIDRTMVRAVMVGDDRTFEVDVDDLTPLDDDDYCFTCGQIGCGH